MCHVQCSCGGVRPSIILCNAKHAETQHRCSRPSSVTVCSFAVSFILNPKDFLHRLHMFQWQDYFGSSNTLYTVCRVTHNSARKETFLECPEFTFRNLRDDSRVYNKFQIISSSNMGTPIKNLE